MSEFLLWVHLPVGQTTNGRGRSSRIQKFAGEHGLRNPISCVIYLRNRFFRSSWISLRFPTSEETP